MEAVNLKLVRQNKPVSIRTPAETAFSILELLHQPLTSESITNIEIWFLETEYYLKQYLTSSVLEFTVLNLIFVNQVFKNFSLNDSEQRLLSSLQRSRLLLTEQRPEPLTILNRLPKFVLRNTTRDGLVFHQSIYRRPDQMLSFHKMLIQIYTDYVPRAKDLVALLILGLMMSFSPIFTELVAGLFVGYCFSSFMEYYVHQNIGHADAAMKRFFKSIGKMGEYMGNFSLEHSIHHGNVNTNYANPFAPNKLDSPSDFVTQVKNRQKVDELVFKRGGEKLSQMIMNSQYGLRSSNMWRTHFYFFPISTFVLLLIELFFSRFTGFAFSLGFLSISTFWITASSIYHPCLHYTEEKVEQELNVLMKWFLKTRLSRFIAHSHRMHHAHGGDVNQNLNIGYDYLFAWAPITTLELIDLKNKKTIY